MTDNNEALEAPETEATQEVPANEVDESVDQQPENEQNNSEQNDGEQNSGHKEEWPQSAVNAHKRNKKAINKYYAQWKSAEEKIADLEAKLNETKPINGEDYETVDEWIEASTQNKIKKELTQAELDREKNNLAQQKQMMEAERLEEIRQQAAEVAKVHTDLPQVWQQNADALNNLPEEVAEMFYSLDNAAAAIYELGKQGKIENLAYMHPQIAAQEIWSAQQRGIQGLSKPQKVNPAPQPMQGAKGRGTTQKTVKQMSPRELVDRFAK